MTSAAHTHHAAPEDKKSSRVRLPRRGTFALALLAIASAFVFAEFLLGFLFFLVIVGLTAFAQLEDIKSFGRILVHIKRDGKGHRGNHLKWWWSDNAKTTDPDAYKEEESTPAWYLVLLFVLGFGPLVVTMFTAPLLPLWVGLILVGVLIALYFYAIILLVRRGNPKPAAPADDDSSDSTATP
jgi:hypothetical protein